MEAGRRSRVETSRRIDVPWRRCKRSTHDCMPSQEDGVDLCGSCELDDPPLMLNIGLMLLSTTVVIDVIMQTLNCRENNEEPNVCSCPIASSKL